MAVSSDYLQFILEQLHGLGEVHSRRMFGAAGLYCDETFFGIISDDTLYLRVDEASRPDYTSRGMQAFRPYADRPEVSMTYFEVPAEVLEDSEELLSWSRRALASRAAGAATVKPKRRRPGRLKRLR
ncbi:MAG: TfoX/Sxy family protein [Steroidobacteraceae bacterium]